MITVNGVVYQTAKQLEARIIELEEKCNDDEMLLGDDDQEEMANLYWWLDTITGIKDEMKSYPKPDDPGPDPGPDYQVCLICGGLGGCSEGCEPPDPF